MSDTERLGSALLELDTEDKKYNKGLDRAERRLKDVGVSMAKVGGIMTATVTGPLALFGKSSLSAFQEQRKATLAVEAALKSMGNQAGFTSMQLQEMASAGQAATTFGDEAILSKVTANLLTFGNIQGEVFKRAQQSALDLSARLGQDLQSSAVMLGKALNDPLIGLTALSRVGVAFTKQQQEQIKEMAKAGDVAGAQAIMLAELEKQYGGQAAALAKADDGLAQLGNQWGDFKEQIGEVIRIVLPSLVAGLRSLVTWFQSLDKDTLKWIVTIGGIVAAVGPVIAVLGGMAAGIGALLPVIAAVGTAIKFLIMGTGPIGLFIGAAVLLTAAWAKWGDDIKILFTTAFEWLRITIEEMRLWLTERFAGITETITAPFRLVVEGAQKAYNLLVGKSIIPDMVTGIEGWLNRLVGSTGSSMGKMTNSIATQTSGQAAIAEHTWGALFTAFAAHSSDMLRVSQVIGAAQAFVSTMVGAAQALALPFPANLIAAAKVIATGLGFVSAIKGTKAAAPARTAVPSLSSGTAAAPARVADAPAVQQAEARSSAGVAAEERVMNVTIQGRSSNKLTYDEMVDDFIPLFETAQRNGATKMNIAFTG